MATSVTSATSATATQYVYTPPDPLTFGPPMHGCLKVTKNRYRGAKIANMEQLLQLANEHKGILIDHGYNYVVSSALWYSQKRASDVYDSLRHGKLYHCIKEEDF